MPRLIAHPRDPVMVDRKLDVAYALYWLILAAWGFVAAFKGLASIREQFGAIYSFYWPLFIATIATVGLVAAVSFFFRTRLAQTTKKRIERTAAIAQSLVVGVYPVALVLSGNYPSAILLLVFILIPVYRIIVLNQRIKQYEA